MSLRRLLPVVLALALVAGGCGGGGAGAARSAPPPEVPVALVPPALGTLTLTEDDQARDTFSKLGDRALVADGRLWQVRQGDRLVATLQVSTVKAKVDLAEPDQRNAIVRHILPGSRQEIDVSGVTVWMSEANDKSVFVWFARDLFQVLQVKSTKLEPEAVVGDLVAYQLQSPEWKGLRVDDEAEL